MAAAAPQVVTEEQYYALPEDDRYELLDGKLEPMPTPDFPHGFAQFRLARLLMSALSDRMGGYVVGEVDVPIRKQRIRRADIVFLATEHHERLRGGRLVGPPDLVVEVVSADHPERDYLDKAIDYAEAGVDHYWIVDPQRQVVRVMEREGDRYPSHREYGLDDVIRSPLLEGEELRPRDFLLL